MGVDNWLLLGKLRRAVKKIKFLLNYNVNRFRLASMIGRTSSSSRRLSFNDRPGLRAAEEFFDANSYDVSSPGSSRGGGLSPLSRTTSFPMEDDIDRRADLFIANFYKQLKLERQVSLKLRYCRGNSFDSASPSP